MPSVNRIIKILIGADLMLITASGFLAPVFAIFLVGSIQGGSATLAGAAVAVHWFTKSIIRIPIAYYLDKKRGESDDFHSLVAGSVIYATAHYLYIFASLPWHIYAIQVLMGIGAAFVFTPWYGFFSRHIDRHHENFEWSIETSLIGLGIAGAGFVAGYVADTFGFTPLFIISGTVALLGAFMLLLIGKNINMKKEQGKHVVEVKIKHRV